MLAVSLRRQRRAGLGYIAVGSVIAVGVWFAVLGPCLP